MSPPHPARALASAEPLSPPTYRSLLPQETQRLLSEPAPGISAQPQENNLRHFSVMIRGPQDSPYEGGVFELELSSPRSTPWRPPRCDS